MATSCPLVVCSVALSPVFFTYRAAGRGGGPGGLHAPHAVHADRTRQGGRLVNNSWSAEAPSPVGEQQTQPARLASERKRLKNGSQRPAPSCWAVCRNCAAVLRWCTAGKSSCVPAPAAKPLEPARVRPSGWRLAGGGQQWPIVRPASSFNGNAKRSPALSVRIAATGRLSNPPTAPRRPDCVPAPPTLSRPTSPSSMLCSSWPSSACSCSRVSASPGTMWYDSTCHVRLGVGGLFGFVWTMFVGMTMVVAVCTCVCVHAGVRGYGGGGEVRLAGDADGG